MKKVELRINGKTYTIEYVKGRVLGKDKNMETKVFGSGGGGYVNQGYGNTGSVSISSQTIIHDKVYIEDENGRETVAELKDWDVACREGHELMLVWLSNNVNKKDVIAIKNFNTNQTKAKDDNIFEICGRPLNKVGWVLLGIITLVAAYFNFIYFPENVTDMFNGRKAVEDANQYMSLGFWLFFILFIAVVFKTITGNIIFNQKYGRIKTELDKILQ